MAGFGNKAYHDALVKKYSRQIRAGEQVIAPPPSSGGFRFTDDDNLSSSVGSGNRKAEPTNPATRLLDILSQPAYASAQGAAEDVAGATDEDSIGHIGNAAFGAVRGIFDPTNYGRGNNKNTLVDALMGEAEFLDDDGNTFLDIHPVAGSKDTTVSKPTVSDDGIFSVVTPGIEGERQKFGITVPGKSEKEFDAPDVIGRTAAVDNDSFGDKIIKGSTNTAAAIASDPATYVPGVAFTKVGEYGLKGAKLIPGVDKVVEATKARYAPKAAQEAMVEAGDVFGAGGRTPKEATRETKLLDDLAGDVTPPPRTPESAMQEAEAAGSKSMAQVISEAPRAHIIDSKALSDAQKGLFTPKINTSNAAKSAADKGEVVQAQMLRNVDTGEEIPFNGNTMRQQRKSKAKDIDKFVELPAPFAKVKVSREATPQPEVVPIDTPPSLAQDDALKIPESPMEWVRLNGNTPLAVKVGPVTSTQSVAEWVRKINSTTVPVSAATKKSINLALQKAYQAAKAGAPVVNKVPVNRANLEALLKSAPSNANFTEEQLGLIGKMGAFGVRSDLVKQARALWPEGLDLPASRPTTGLPAGVEPTTLDDLARPAQGRTAAMVEEVAGKKAEELQLARISGQALQNLKAKYKRLLSDDDFTWLWETVKDNDAVQFGRRKSKLQGVGRATGEPQWERFTKDVIKAPLPPTGAELMAQEGITFGNDALYAAINGGTPPAQIIEAAPKTPEVRMERRAERIQASSPDSLDDVTRNALESAAKDQQWAGQVWPFTSKSGAARTHNTPGQGNAIYRHSANAKFQANLFNSLVAEIKGLGVLEGKQTWAYANTMMQELLPRLRAAENYLLQNGVTPVGGTQSSGLPILLSDVLDALAATNEGRQFLAGRVFNAIGFVPRGSEVKGVRGIVDADGLVLAMNAIMKGMDPEAIKTADDIAVAVRASLQGKIKQIRSDSLKGLTQDASRLPTTFVDGARVSASVADSKVVIKQFLELVLPKSAEDYRVVERMADLVKQRAANHGIEFGDKVAALSEETVNRMADAIVNPNVTTAQMANMLGDVPGVVKKVAKAEPEKMSQEVVSGSTRMVEEGLTEVLPKAEIQQAEGLRNISKAAAKKDKKAKKAASQNQYNDAVAEAQTEVMKLDAMVDMGKNTEAAINQGTFRRLFPSSAKAPRVFAHGGNATLHDSLVKFGSVGRMLRNWTNDIIVGLNNKYDDDILKAAYDYLRHPNANVDPQVMEAAVEMKKITDVLFDSPSYSGPWKQADDAAQGVMRHFFSRGFDPEHLMDKMSTARLGMKDSYKFDMEFAAKQVADGKAMSIEDALGRQILDMRVDDPLDYLSKMTDVMATASTDMSIAHEASRIISSQGFASKVPKAGYAKMDNAQSNVIARYLNTDLYYDKDILSELRVMDMILSQSTDLGGAFGQFVSRTMDPLLNMWKRGMTIYRPGHHVRNAVGDMSLSFMVDGVKNPMYYYKAKDMIGARARYEGVDFLRMTQGLSPRQLAESRHTIKASIKGKPTELTDDVIHEALMRRGVYPDFAIQEDLLESVVNPAIQRAQENMSIFGGRVGRVAGNASEARDDWVRTAHALHLLENSKGYKSVDELFDFVAKQVRKSHPDGSDLTGFERKYMRRIIPFYSWSRKAIPLVVESMASHPGRALVFPKAQLEFARQFGVEGESLGNPFPKDQLFANYFMDDVSGPMYQNDDGEYYGINPGIPTNDILNDYVGGDLGETFLGQLAPAFKVPMELASGTDLGTGAKITDRGEYLGRQVPGISHLQSLTGKEALSGFTEDIGSVEKGNRENLDKNSLLNMLLGLGVTNQSTPSGIRQGQIDMRNNLGTGG